MAEKDPVAGSHAIEVRELAKSFGNFPVLRGIDTSIGKGEFVAIFGPNGAGKTTLIKLLATIMKPSSGGILVEGIDIKRNTEEVRRSIGLVTHQTFLYHNLTAYENLDFYCRLYDVPQRKERIEEMVALMGLSSRLAEKVGTFSRGMQQRLSIARALLHKPAIMLLDEPETGLDQEAISILWQILRRDNGGRCSVVLTTHNLERGLELCDRLLILDRGRIVYEGEGHGLDLPGLREIYRQRTQVGA
jgi:heme ABC exporter ATP-binding subunit CcmA